MYTSVLAEELTVGTTSTSLTPTTKTKNSLTPPSQKGTTWSNGHFSRLRVRDLTLDKLRGTFKLTIT
jgi:hypothetical protein